MRGIKFSPYFLFLLVCSLLVGASCNNSNSSNSNEEDSLSTKMAEAKDQAEQEKDAFLNTWNKNMDQLDKRIDEWSQQAKTYSGKKKEQAQEKLDSLKAQSARLKEKINRAADKHSDNWEDFKKDVNDSYDTLVSRFKNTFDGGDN